MTPAELTAWRTRMGWLKGEAAAALGLSPNGYAAYERGYARGYYETGPGTWKLPRPIPKHIELACEALEARKSTKGRRKKPPKSKQEPA